MFTFIGLTFSLATVHIWTSIYSFVFFLLGAGMWMASASDDPDSAAPVATDARPERMTMWSRQTEPVMRREDASVTLAREVPDDMPDAPPDDNARRYTRFAEGSDGSSGYRRPNTKSDT
jgi:hypothetical protein